MRELEIAEVPDYSKKLGVRALETHEYFVVSILVFLSIFGSACAADTQMPTNVLVLFSSFASTDTDFLNDIEPALRARVPRQITFYDAYLEFSRVNEKSYLESQAETFHRTYDGVKFSLVIVSNSEALHFAVHYRDKIFPGVPIVFVEVNPRELEGTTIGPGITGLTVPVGLRETIDLALRLQPDTEVVAVITTKPEDYWLGVAHFELLRYRDKVREIDLIGPASGQLLDRVAALPPHTVVLFQLAPQASQQPELGTFEFLAAVAQRLPVYSAWPGLCLNYGCIGGAYPDSRKQHLWAAEIAARVLSGERPEYIPVANNSDLQVTVDSRALRHWNIPESALPSGALVLYREPTLWERDRKYIIAGIALILAQSLLIMRLLWQRARKRKAEAVLRESERRFRVMADTTPSLIWMCDQDGSITYLNNRRMEFTGGDPKAGYGETWEHYVHPDDLPGLISMQQQALKTPAPFSTEYRLRRPDGEYRWMFDVASPRVNGDGAFAGYIGSAIDTTDQKIAQQALANVSGRLIEAQEKERSRIARDLHDDICQRLALLSMELEQANRNGAPPNTKKHLEEMRQHCSEIAADVQSLSHQLHSSKLEYLGIVAAVRGFCKEFEKQHEVRIDFKDENVLRNLSKDTSLCLFRVAQEALHNAVKYSGTDRIAVDLSATECDVRLSIKDEGVGFDVEEAKKKSGLGLLSMQERVHLVRGHFHIESKPGAGTTVVAIVPISATPQPPLDLQADYAGAGVS